MAQYTLDEMQAASTDVLEMLQEYQRQSGLAMHLMVTLHSGPISTFVSTLQPEQLAPLLRSLANRIESDVDADEDLKAPPKH
jgi:hypothetical protein